MRYYSGGRLVSMTTASYRRILEARRIAEVQRDSEMESAEHARAWARDCLRRERHLADRCTFLYGVARSLGASVEDLTQ